MPYLVHGSAQQLAELFDSTWLTETREEADGAKTIVKDLPRLPILGSEQQAQHVIKTWQDSSNKKTYAQGNMSADNTFLFLNNPFLLKREDEEMEVYRANIARHSFAYVTCDNHLAGVMIYYRKDKPEQWLLAVSEDPQLEPQERKLTLLANFDLQPYIKNPLSPLSLDVVDRLNNTLMEQIKAPFIKDLLSHALYSDDGKINQRVARVEQVLRVPDAANNLKLPDSIDFTQISVQQLFTDNAILDLFCEHNIKLSFNMLRDCMTQTSGLCQEIEALRLSAEPEINQCLLKMTLCFYENALLKKHRALLQELLINKTIEGQIWNDAQIELTPSLIKANYSPKLIELILSKQAYYDAVVDLQVLGLTQDIPEHFAHPVKLKELEFLKAVAAKSIKYMCLIFWVKGSLSSQDYTLLINAAKDYPLLAKTLIALDKTGEYHIKDLQEWALNEKEQLQQSIIHHYGERFPINNAILNKLDDSSLKRLSLAFKILAGKENISKKSYELVVRDSPQGYLLRLFLPSFATIIDSEQRNDLIDLLYEGVQKGPITLSKRVAVIKDEALKIEALKLQDRLLCAKQMQKLNFSNERISFVADAYNPAASKLRDVILKVEAQCKKIHERLLRENHSPVQQKSWQEAEKQYRVSLYEIAYQALTEPGFDFKKHLNKEQKKVLKIVDPQIKSWAYKCLIVIANVFIMALTLALANQIKFNKTGNFWFFNCTKSGEELSALGQELNEQIKPRTT